MTIEMRKCLTIDTLNTLVQDAVQAQADAKSIIPISIEAAAAKVCHDIEAPEWAIVVVSMIKGGLLDLGVLCERITKGINENTAI